MDQHEPRSLAKAFAYIESERKLRGDATTHRGVLGQIEGVAHELAHQLEAGRNFVTVIRRSTSLRANAHEMATLRIEVAALARLGVIISLRSLWRDANWQDWRGARPSFRSVTRRLSRRERRCVAAFVRIVERAQAAIDRPTK